MVRFLLLMFFLQLVLMPLYSQEVRLGLPVGHTERIFSAQFSSDGKSIVTASSDNTAKIWDVASGKMLHNLEGHTAQVTSAVFSPDGKRILTSSEDNTVKIWDAHSGELLYCLERSDVAVYSAVFSPDGKSIVTASGDNTAILWDVASGKMLHNLTGHTYYVTAAQFSPNGKRIVTASGDNTAKVWDAVSGKLLHSLEGHTFEVTAAQFSPDGKRILTSSMGTAKVWDARSGKVLHSLDGHTYDVTATFSPDGKMIMTTASGDNTAMIWDASSGKHLQNFCNFNDNEPLFSPDGQKVVIARANLVGIWDARSGIFITYIVQDNNMIESIQFSPDGKRIVTTAYWDEAVKVWDASSGKLLHNLNGHTSNISCASYSPDGKNIFAAYWSETAKVWDASTGMSLHNLEVQTEAIHLAAFSPDGKKIVAASRDNVAMVWDALSGKLLLNLEAYSCGYYSAVFNHDGQRIVTASTDHTAKVWDAVSGKLLHRLEGHTYYVTAAQFSPNGKRILTSSLDSTAKVWDAESGKLLLSIGEDSSWVSFASYSPNGQKIVTTGNDGTARIWDAESGRLLQCMPTIDSTEYSYYSPDDEEDFTCFLVFTLHSASFSPEGQRIVAGSSDKKVRVWDADSGNLLHCLEGHTDIVRYAQFSPDGKNILSVSDDNTAKVWDVSSGNLIRNIPLKGIWCDVNFENNTIISHHNSMLTLWDMESGKEIYSFVAIDSTDYLLLHPEKYYMATKNAASKLYWIVDNTKIYPFEQFDLKYNRPDIVLARLGFASPELIEAYHQAYLKRLKKMGFTEEQLSGEFHIPETAIENFEYMPVIDEKDFEIDLNFNDSKYKLDRYNIWINDVPLFGMTGKSLRNENTDTFKTKERIVLNEGRNKIQVSCLNEKGAESYKETVEISYTPKKREKHDLYLVAVSVSEYEDSQFNLKYAVKDGRDMVKLLSDNRNGDFANIYIDTLFNSAATTDNLIAVKQKLMQSNVDDEVILYVSGHGLLDDNLDFYFASHNVDFSNPSVNGISYDALEGLLDGIPARKKLLLMDACHSGEVDKEDTQQEPDNNVLLADGKKSGLTTYSYKGAVMKHSSDPNKVGLQNSFDLMQELFANLNRGSGAVVISAAAGVGYALEGEQWNNGVFTYALLDGLYNQRADANGDKQVSLSELRTYVISEVDRLTNGRQRPTCRQENLEFEWRVW